MNKLVWIVETIRKAGRISFEEINEKWRDNVDLSGGGSMVKRTFHKWKEAIYKTFDISIECEPFAPYCYYIANEVDWKSGSIETWLLKTYSVCNSLAESKSIKDRILLEDVPSGRDYLQLIIDAMKQNRFIHFSYFSYSSNQRSEKYVMPLCVKLFRQRWYMVGRTFPKEYDVIFCLDRMSDFRYSSHTFEYPENFSPEEYFSGTFGIINDQNCDVTTVKLKATARQANYLRDLPLHESQKEVERAKDYNIFTVRVRPTFDFEQELLWNRENVEVLEPEWFRNRMGAIVKEMGKKYAGSGKRKGRKQANP